MGSIGAGGQKQTSKSTPIDMTPQEYAALRSTVANALKGGIPELGSTLQDYLASGATAGLTAPMGKEESSAWRNLISGFGNEDALLKSTISGNYLSPESNPFLREVIAAAQRPLREEYMQGDLANRALFTRAGQTIQESSPFSMAGAKLAGDYLSSLGDVSGKIAYENYSAERQRQIEAVQTRFDLAKQTLEATALPRLIQEQGIERGTAEFNRRMAMIQEILRIAAGLSAPTVANASESRGIGWNFNASYGGGGSEV